MLFNCCVIFSGAGSTNNVEDNSSSGSAELPATIFPSYNPHVSASKLSLTDELALLGLPLPPGCYHGNPQVALLTSDFDQPLHTFLETKLFSLATPSYKKPDKAEEQFTQPNLIAILNLILSGIPPTATEESFSVQAELYVARYFSSFLAKHNSKHEGAVVFDRGSTKLVVVAAEAKDQYAGPAEAYAQGVSLASDAALDQVEKGVPHDKVLVPFVLAFGDSVQFGAVYVVSPNFPCAVLLSHPLSLLVWETRQEICRWVLAISAFCARQFTVFAGVKEMPAFLKKKAVQKGAVQKSTVHKCALTPTSVFLKPVQAENLQARYCLCHLMSIYQLLFLHGECKKFVLFPLGTMGLPRGISTNSASTSCML